MLRAHGGSSGAGRLPAPPPRYYRLGSHEGKEARKHGGECLAVSGFGHHPIFRPQRTSYLAVGVAHASSDSQRADFLRAFVLFDRGVANLVSYRTVPAFASPTNTPPRLSRTCRHT